jgi:PAS domain S-box-containing protein
MLGKDRQELISSCFSFFLANESKPVFKEFLWKVINHRSTQTCEIQLDVNRDLPVSFLLVGTRTDYEELILITATDITGYNRTKNELVATKDGLKIIFDNAPVIMCVIDRERHVLNINPAFTKFTGLVLDDLHGGRVGELVDCINAGKNPSACGFGINCAYCDLRVAIEDTFATGRRYNDIEYNATVTNDGMSRNISLIGSTALVHEDGEAHLLLYLYDITERKHSEEDMRKIGKYYKAITDKAPGGVVLLSAEGQFKYISPSAKLIFGYDPEINITKNPLEMTHPDDVNMLLNELDKIIKDPAYIPTLQYRMIDNSGNWKWVETTFRNLLDDNNVEAIVQNFHDITDRKLAEEKSRHQMEELTRWQAVTLGREDRNRELKQEVNELLAMLGQPARYPSQVRSSTHDMTNEPGEAESVENLMTGNVCSD